MGNTPAKEVIQQWNDDPWLLARPSIRYFIPVFGHPLDARSFIREANYTSSDDHIFGTFIMAPSHQPLFEKMSNQELLDRFGVFDPKDYKTYLDGRKFHYTHHGTSKKRSGYDSEFGKPQWLPPRTLKWLSYSTNLSDPNVFQALPSYDDNIPLLTVKQLDISTTIHPGACVGISAPFLQQNLPLPEIVPYLRISALTPDPNDQGYIEPIFSDLTLKTINTRVCTVESTFLEFFAGPIFGLRPILPPLPLANFSPVLRTKLKKEDHSQGQSPPPQISINNSNYKRYEYPIPVCYSIESCYQYDFTTVLKTGDRLSPSYPLHLATILLIDLQSPFGPLTFYSFIRETVSLLSKGSTLPLVGVPIFILTMGEQHLDDNNAVLTEHSMREALIQLGFSDISFYNSRTKTNENSLKLEANGKQSVVKSYHIDPPSLDMIGGPDDLKKEMHGLVPEQDFRAFVQPIHDCITLKHFEILSQGHFDRDRRFPVDLSSGYERPAPSTHALLPPSQIMTDIGPLELNELEKPISDFSLVATAVQKQVGRDYKCFGEYRYVEHPTSPAFLHRCTALRALQMFFTILRAAFANGIHPLQLSTSTKAQFSPLKPTPSPLYYLFKEYHEQFFGPKPKWVDVNGPNGTTFVDCSRWNHHPEEGDKDDDDDYSTIIANPSLLPNRIPFLSNPLPDYFMRGYQGRIAWLEQRHGYKTPMGYLNTTTNSNTWLSSKEGENLANNAGIQHLPRDLYYRNPYDVLQPVQQKTDDTKTSSGSSSNTTPLSSSSSSSLAPLAETTTAASNTVIIGTLTTTLPDFLPPDQLPTRVHFESLIYIAHDYLFSLDGYPDDEQCPRYITPTILSINENTKQLTTAEAIQKAKSLNYSPSQSTSTLSPGVFTYIKKTGPEKGSGQLVEFFPDWCPDPYRSQYPPGDLVIHTPSASHITKRQEIVTLLLQAQFGQFSNSIGLQNAIKIWRMKEIMSQGGAALRFLKHNPFPTTNFHKNHPKPTIPTFLQQLHPTTAQQLSHFHTTATHTVPTTVIGHQVDVTMTYTTHSSWNTSYERDFYETKEVSDEIAFRLRSPGGSVKPLVLPHPVPFWLPQYRNNGVITPLQYVHSVVIFPFAYSRCSPSLPSSSPPVVTLPPPPPPPPIPSISLYPVGDNHCTNVFGLSFASTSVFKLPPGLLQSHSPVTFLILCMNPILEDQDDGMEEKKLLRDVYEVNEANDPIEYSLEPIPRQQFEFFQNNMPRITKYELIYRQFTQFTKSPEAWVDPQRLELLWDVQFIHNEDLPSVFGQLEQAAVANRLKMFAGQR